MSGRSIGEVISSSSLEEEGFKKVPKTSATNKNPALAFSKLLRDVSKSLISLIEVESCHERKGRIANVARLSSLLTGLLSSGQTRNKRGSTGVVQFDRSLTGWDAFSEYLKVQLDLGVVRMDEDASGDDADENEEGLVVAVLVLPAPPPPGVLVKRGRPKDSYDDQAKKIVRMQKQRSKDNRASGVVIKPLALVAEEALEEAHKRASRLLGVSTTAIVDKYRSSVTKSRQLSGEVGAKMIESILTVFSKELPTKIKVAGADTPLNSKEAQSQKRALKGLGDAMSTLIRAIPGLAVHFTSPATKEIIDRMSQAWDAHTINDFIDERQNMNFSALQGLNTAMSPVTRDYPQYFKNGRFSMLANKTSVQRYRAKVEKFFDDLIPSKIVDGCAQIDYFEFIKVLMRYVIWLNYLLFQTNYLLSLYNVYRFRYLPAGEQTIYLNLANDGTDFGQNGTHIVVLALRFLNIPFDDFKLHSTAGVIPIRLFIGKDTREEICARFREVYEGLQPEDLYGGNDVQAQDDVQGQSIMVDGQECKIVCNFAGDMKSHVQTRGRDGGGPSQSACTFSCCSFSLKEDKLQPACACSWCLPSPKDAPGDNKIVRALCNHGRMNQFVGKTPREFFWIGELLAMLKQGDNDASFVPMPQIGVPQLSADEKYWISSRLLNPGAVQPRTVKDAEAAIRNWHNLYGLTHHGDLTNVTSVLGAPINTVYQNLRVRMDVAGEDLLMPVTEAAIVARIEIIEALIVDAPHLPRAIDSDSVEYRARRVLYYIILTEVFYFHQSRDLACTKMEDILVPDQLNMILCTLHCELRVGTMIFTHWLKKELFDMEGVPQSVIDYKVGKLEALIGGAILRQVENGQQSNFKLRYERNTVTMTNLNNSKLRDLLNPVCITQMYDVIHGDFPMNLVKKTQDGNGHVADSVKVRRHSFERFFDLWQIIVTEMRRDTDWTRPEIIKWQNSVDEWGDLFANKLFSWTECGYYTHALIKGHFRELLERHGNLHKHCQQAFEKLNSDLKKYLYNNTQGGGGGNNIHSLSQALLRYSKRKIIRLLFPTREILIAQMNKFYGVVDPELMDIEEEPEEDDGEEEMGMEVE